MSAVTDEQDALTGLRVAVLGPGGVGGLLAALLARGGAAVTCLAGAATAEQLRTAGIRVESAHFGDSTTPVDAAERLTAPVDVLLVTVKATQLDDALERVPADVLGDALVVPLLNGVEHVDLLRHHYPEVGVVPATIRVESTRTAPGVIRHGSPFVTVDLVAVPGLEQRVRRLADALQEAGVPTRVGDDEPAALWSKLTSSLRSRCSPPPHRRPPARSASPGGRTWWPSSARSPPSPAPRVRPPTRSRSSASSTASPRACARPCSGTPPRAGRSSWTRSAARWSGWPPGTASRSRYVDELRERYASS